MESLCLTIRDRTMALSSGGYLLRLPPLAIESSMIELAREIRFCASVFMGQECSGKEVI